jgi:hypothetical protein
MRHATLPDTLMTADVGPPETVAAPPRPAGARDPSPGTSADGIEFFPWSPPFETGLPEIDAQHRNLVALLNRLATELAIAPDEPRLGQVFDDGPGQLQQFKTLLLLAPAGERMVAQVTRKANPARHHDVRVRPAAAHPVGRVLDQSSESHHGL